MKKLLFLPLFVTIIFTGLTGQSNLFIDDSYTVEEMIMDFFDTPGIEISNVSLTGSTASIGFYDAGGTDLGLNAGIIFSTGNIFDAIGPNDSGGTNGSTGSAGDADIDIIGNGILSQDAVVVEFDLTVEEIDSFHLNYIFGSEEYPEFVNSDFNDAFIFLISGPGFEGPFSNDAENISLIPGTDTPVAINSLNADSNSVYYVDNSEGIHIEYDAFTTPLPASFIAQPGATYHIKMVVADLSDTAFDSAIFLSYNSLGQDDFLMPPTEFQFVVNGSSVEFANMSRYARSWEWDFGNDVTSTERNPEPVEYSEPGNYTVSLVTQNYCCSDTFTTVVEVAAPVPMTAVIETTDALCNGGTGTINLEISGGVLPYDEVVWSPVIDDLENVPAGSYMYSITDQAGTTLDGSVTVEEPEVLEISFETMDEMDDLENGAVSIDVTGGTAPYLYLWNNGLTTSDLEGVSAGEYILTVTDANNCEQTQTVVIDLLLGFPELEESELILFPNPVNDYLVVEWSIEGIFNQVKVFNASGKEIAVSSRIGERSVTLNFSQKLSAGVYYLELATEEGGTFTKQFIAE